MEIKNGGTLRVRLGDAAASAKYARQTEEHAQTAALCARNAQAYARSAEDSARSAVEAVAHSPRIVNGCWQVWDADRAAYIETGLPALGLQGETGATGATGPQGPQGAPGSACVNLLDNWYFGGSVVNQRGNTSVTGTGKHIVDRWKSTGASTTVLDAIPAGVRITGSSTTTYSGMTQLIRPQLPAGTYTLSLFVSEATGSGVRLTVYDEDAGSETTNIDTSGGLVSWTFTLAKKLSSVRIATRPYASSCTILAVKLELGGTQTLARNTGTAEAPVWALNDPPPNVCTELLKCQRFFQVFRTDTLRPTYGIDFRPVMATDEPTLDSFVLDTTTYYTASSEP